MGITERISRTTDLTAWQGEIPTNYVYTLGRAEEKFFRTIMEKGRLTGTKCDACEIVYVPPRIYCEQCLERLEKNYMEVNKRGTVHTFTLCFEAMDGTRHDKPHILAMVKIDDTDGGLIHYLGEVKPEDVYIGMPVEAVFKAKNDRVGSIHDIKYFKPA
jgi:uncharacterized OB-fold protein